MFHFDLFSEVGASMSRNKLRVALTGFSIAFGIFMLIVLLAAGNGLLNGIQGMHGTTTNKIQIWGGWTSKEWHGRSKYRRVCLNAKRFEAVLQYYDDCIERYIPGIERSVTMSVGRKNRSVQLTGIAEDYIHITDMSIVAGRWLNAIDNRECRKVAVMDKETAEVLFSGREPAGCVGEWVKINGLMFRLVGIYASANNHSQDQETFAPFKTMATIYSEGEMQLSTIHLSLRGLETAEANAEFEKKLNETMARIEDYDPTDHGLWVWNKAEDYLEQMKMMNGMRLFIWIIGVASLFAGVVGISNIMLITVRERTREFGIRKAIGAKPRSIITLVLAESVTITVLFGYVGMFLGIGLSQLANNMLNAMPKGEFQVFVNPTVDMGIVVGANVIMVLAGLLAGYVPARRAARIRPVAAMRAE